MTYKNNIYVYKYKKSLVRLVYKVNKIQFMSRYHID